MNNDINEAFEALKQYMKNNFNAKIVSGGREILKRCHFCGDSRDPSNAHMYIGLKNGVIVYNCFKCNSRGVVDGKFLRNLGCYDTNIILLCQSNSNKLNIKDSNYLQQYQNSRNLIIPLSNNSYISNIKLKYLSNRMGNIFGIRDAARFKIIISLKEFLYANNINYYTRNENVIDIIDEYFLGFLSMDNKYVILRRIIPEGNLPNYIDYRYVIYNIYGDMEEGMKYYAIPTNIYMTNTDLDIHIAEGVFDILSIYLHVAPIGANGIFASASGKEYLGLIRYFIIKYGFNGFNLHLYLDADVPNYKMERIKEEISPFNIKMFIHRNMFNNEKDFGVPMNRIIDSSIRF